MINDDKSNKTNSMTEKSRGTKQKLPKVDEKLDIYSKLFEKHSDRLKKNEAYKIEVNNSNHTNNDSKQEEGSVNTHNDAVSISQADTAKNKRKKEEKTSPMILNSFTNNIKHLSVKARYTLKQPTLKNKAFWKFSDKLNEVHLIRNKLTEDYAKLSVKNYFKGKKDIIQKWKTSLDYLQTADVRLFLIGMFCLADLYVEFDEFETAKHIYFSFKFFANYLELPEEVMQAYEALANVYKFLFQYHKAIKCYKKQIEIAWILNDKVSELRAYDNIGIQYFYLGNREKAKYYHERMLYGRIESFSTDIRRSVCDNYKNKNFHLFNEDKFVKIMRSNDELKEKLKESLALFEDNKEVDLENVDIIKNQEQMNNSFISEIDMSFSIIPENYLLDINYLPEISNKKYSHNNFKSNSTSNLKKRKVQMESNFRGTSSIVDNMILSHLSTKRKEFNSDRFKKIFDRFDKLFEELRKQRERKDDQNNQL